jgi:molybdate transport system substrate-binding protein
VRIAAAADLRFAMDELRSEFGRHEPLISLEPTFGSSGNFYAQLANEAPFDLFLSADIEFPRKLINQGQGLPESGFEYAVGELVVWVQSDSPIDIANQGLSALALESVRRIAIANPQHAPYGRAAEAALKHQELYDAVRGRLVLADNVAQALQFVDSGAADVGLVAASLAMAPSLRDKGRFQVVDPGSYPPIVQGGVIMKWALDREAAASFRQFLLGAEGRSILLRYGFRLPDGAP